MATQAISTHLDPNTHGEGWLQAIHNYKVFTNNTRICVFGDPAFRDRRCSDKRPRHCYPWAISGSTKVFIKNIPVHRVADLRLCGARTISFFLSGGSNIKVFAG